MGVPAHEALQVGSIMATKLVSNEFVAMMDLQKIASTLSPRAEGILSVFLGLLRELLFHRYHRWRD